MQREMSREAARRSLEEQLDGPVPRGIAELSPEDLAHLADAIRTARHRQARALEEAGEHALARIPRLLRGPIRKVVG